MIEFVCSPGYHFVTVDLMSGEISNRSSCRPNLDANEYAAAADRHGPGASIVYGVKAVDLPCVGSGTTDITVNIDSVWVSQIEFGDHTTYEESSETYSHSTPDGTIIAGDCRLYMLHGIVWYDAMLM